MKLFVISEAYPSPENLYPASFLHTRCIEFLKKGAEIVVLSFSAQKSYVYEGVVVMTEKEVLKGNVEFDLIMSHAPNLKNHIRLLKMPAFSSQPLICYFHGHEVMNTAKYYPKAFDFDKKNRIKKWIQFFYDPIKLLLLKRFLKKSINERVIKFVFVSDWMQKMAFDSMRLSSGEVKLFTGYSRIIPNGVNDYFLKNKYQTPIKPLADFVTIRPFDNSKYGVDLVYKLAIENPNKTFHVYGKGEFFKHEKELKNLKVFNKFIAQKDIPSLLNQYRSAIMPTRLDAQGVMMCEIAVYGMPLLTSDISICHEMLDEFPNVGYFSNELSQSVDLDELLFSLSSPAENMLDLRFDNKSLSEKELFLAAELLKHKGSLKS